MYSVCVGVNHLLALLLPHTSALAHENINVNVVAISHVGIYIIGRIPLSQRGDFLTRIFPDSSLGSIGKRWMTDGSTSSD